MNKARNYRYVIELESPIWPRKLADELMGVGGISEHLVSVTDLQNDGHIYGTTYTTRSDDDERRSAFPGLGFLIPALRG